MMIQKIERVDDLPLILYWLMQMKVIESIDSIYTSPTNRDGLTYGRLSVLFVTYVIHSLKHRLSGMEEWLISHKTVIGRVTGWQLNDKDATDDRLGRMTEVLGEDEDKSTEFQMRTGQQIVTAYELPTDIARYDTTSFNVYHQCNNNDKSILRFGYSKDHRPDLLQYKQGLGTIDPSGIPLMTDTISGEKADDRCYVPAWRRMVKTAGRSDFLFIADSKAASSETRGTLAREGGYYLFPLPMTGDIPDILKDSVLNPPEKHQEIILSPRAGEEDGCLRNVGVGFVIGTVTEGVGYSI